METTSKIKTVVSTKPYVNDYGTTIYHNLLMENGDKISIGKKNEQKVGWELTYEIVDTGQEYNKAKAIKKSEVIETNQPTNKNEGVQRMIVAQNSITNAVNFHQGSGPNDEADILNTAEKFFNWVIKKGGENGSN
jgi:hypothetical protein